MPENAEYFWLIHYIQHNKKSGLVLLPLLWYRLNFQITRLLRLGEKQCVPNSQTMLKNLRNPVCRLLFVREPLWQIRVDLRYLWICFFSGPSEIFFNLFFFLLKKHWVRNYFEGQISCRHHTSYLSICGGTTTLFRSVKEVPKSA